MTCKMQLASARPYPYTFNPESTALVIIDMQRDFLDAGGFGQVQCGNDEIFNKVREVVPNTQKALAAARELGLHIVHTREGHLPDLSDLPSAKKLRQTSSPSGHHTIGIGDKGPLGRLLVRGEYGHDIIDELRPHPGEVVIDKPGKGSFWNTTFHRALLARGVTHLMFAGVTTECCVNSTAREAADRGFECCVLSDCTSGFDTSFVTKALDMLCSYDGLFGYVGSSQELLSYASNASAALTPQREAFNGDISLESLRKQYRSRQVQPTEVIKHIAERISKYEARDSAVWTYLEAQKSVLHAAQALEKRYVNQPLPTLYGIPFAVKDNIDVANIPTTSVCEAYTYTPTKNAKVVDALIQAGAIFIGKTNLDQLATGLSGCRSPYGSPRSVYGRDRISGGSSSGSSVAVGANLVSFALGTDTAGSGRVPAAFNGIVGYKPTKGTLSAQGLVPASKTLDTISVLAPTVREARTVWLAVDEGPDLDDIYCKPQHSFPLWHVDFRGPKSGGFTFGVPPPEALEILTPTYRSLFAASVDRMRSVGGNPVVVPWTSFAAASELLYAGTLLADRLASIGVPFLSSAVEADGTLHHTTHALFTSALQEWKIRPWDIYSDQHAQAQHTRSVSRLFAEQIDVLLVPTVPEHPTVAEMEANPLKLNAKLGEFTHFANVLDLCGIALPAGEYTAEDEGKLPFGVTILGPSGRDGKVFDIAREFERADDRVL